MNIKHEIMIFLSKFKAYRRWRGGFWHDGIIGEKRNGHLRWGWYQITWQYFHTLKESAEEDTPPNYEGIEDWTGTSNLAQ